MPTTAVRQTKLKVLLKDAVSEVFEDIGLTRAIQEGEKTKTISRARVLKTLKSWK